MGGNLPIPTKDSDQTEPVPAQVPKEATKDSSNKRRKETNIQRERQTRRHRSKKDREKVRGRERRIEK